MPPPGRFVRLVITGSKPSKNAPVSSRSKIRMVSSQPAQGCLGQLRLGAWPWLTAFDAPSVVAEVAVYGGTGRREHPLEFRREAVTGLARGRARWGRGHDCPSTERRTTVILPATVSRSSTAPMGCRQGHQKCQEPSEVL